MFGPELPQVGALPVRRGKDGALQVLLVTSRETKRWIIPKGWPGKGLKPHKSAAREARQEAGLVGRIAKTPIGSYFYWKRRVWQFDLCRVSVFVLVVDRQLKAYREKGERQLRWMPPAEAAALVQETGLRDLLAHLPASGPIKL